MLSSAWLLGVLSLVGAFQTPEPPQPVSPASFVGTWVGLQTVANNTSPGVQEGQTVTMTIDMVDGRLIGTLSPFFGGDDGARFVNVQIAGEELKASAVVGKLERGAPPSDYWKNSTRIEFTLRADRTHLKGTADVRLSGVQWMQYTYDLEKKRSRY